MRKTVSLKNEHGFFKCTTEDLDVMIERYLPCALNSLRTEVAERVFGDATSNQAVEFATSVASITEALIILADCTRPISGFDW